MERGSLFGERLPRHGTRNGSPRGGGPSNGGIYLDLKEAAGSPIILVISSVEVARMILLESTISFLGLGIQPPTPTWGNILGEGRQYIDTAWWIAFFPGIALMTTVLASTSFQTGSAITWILINGGV